MKAFINFKFLILISNIALRFQIILCQSHSLIPLGCFKEWPNFSNQMEIEQEQLTLEWCANWCSNQIVHTSSKKSGNQILLLIEQKCICSTLPNIELENWTMSREPVIRGYNNGEQQCNKKYPISVYCNSLINSECEILIVSTVEPISTIEIKRRVISTHEQSSIEIISTTEPSTSEPISTVEPSTSEQRSTVERINTLEPISATETISHRITTEFEIISETESTHVTYSTGSTVPESSNTRATTIETSTQPSTLWWARTPTTDTSSQSTTPESTKTTTTSEPESTSSWRNSTTIETTSDQNTTEVISTWETVSTGGTFSTESTIPESSSTSTTNTETTSSQDPTPELPDSTITPTTTSEPESTSSWWNSTTTIETTSDQSTTKVVTTSETESTSGTYSTESTMPDSSSASTTTTEPTSSQDPTPELPDSTITATTISEPESTSSWWNSTITIETTSGQSTTEVVTTLKTESTSRTYSTESTIPESSSTSTTTTETTSSQDPTPELPDSTITPTTSEPESASSWWNSTTTIETTSDQSTTEVVTTLETESTSGTYSTESTMPDSSSTSTTTTETTSSQSPTPEWPECPECPDSTITPSTASEPESTFTWWNSTTIETTSHPNTTEIVTTWETELPINTTSPVQLPETSTSGPCRTGVECTATDSYGRYWSACAGERPWKDCPAINTTGNATWFCQYNGYFQGNTPNYTNCKNDWISDVEKQIEQGTPIPPAKAEELIDTILQKSKENKYFGHEIGAILILSSKVLSQTWENVSVLQIETLTDNTWETFGNILSSKESWEELSIETRAETGTDFLTSLEATALQLTHRISHDQSNTLEGESLYRRNFDKFNEFKLLSGVQLNQISPLTFPEEYNTKETHMDLPADWASYFVDQKIKFVGITIGSQEANNIFPGHLINVDSSIKNSSGKFLNSNIMGFSFGSEQSDSIVSDVTNLDWTILNTTIGNQTLVQQINFTRDGVRITFRHDIPAWGNDIANVRRRLHDGEIPKAVIGTSACVFWDPNHLLWSSDGCFLVESKQDETICECKHLTAFALLMDVHNYIGKDFALELLTLILCPISIICLVICLIIFLTVQSERSPRNELTINLCICLLIGNLLIVFLMDKHYFNFNDGLCIASAILIHYFFLCAVMWMALEGFLIFKMLFLDVFSQGKDYMILQHGVAYGIPFLIVGITGLIHGLSNDIIYGNDSFCWLNGNYIWTFMGPTALIILLNFLVLIFSFRKAYNVYNNPQTSVKRKAKSCLTWINSCFSVSIVLGLTWIFGFLMAIDNSTLANISAYIFTVLNASQGILLLIFHGIMNEKLRSALKKRFPSFSIFTDSSNRPANNNTSSTARSGPSFGSKAQQSYESIKNSIFRRSPKDIDDDRMPDLVILQRGKPKVEINAASFSSFA